jgi:hypothetical protein
VRLNFALNLLDNTLLGGKKLILFIRFGLFSGLALSAGSENPEIVLLKDENHFFVLKEVEPRNDSIHLRQWMSEARYNKGSSLEPEVLSWIHESPISIPVVAGTGQHECIGNQCGDAGVPGFPAGN